MDLDRLAARMAENAGRIRALVEGVPDAQARWKPDATSWSILEVVNHLFDEEREDFRLLLDRILASPTQPWPGPHTIDPRGWVTERGYNERALDASMDDFLAERQASLAWLRGLSSPDWEAAWASPFGRITAGDVMASWVAHDLLHMRQLVRLHWLWTTAELEPHSVRYAGSW